VLETKLRPKGFIFFIFGCLGGLKGKKRRGKDKKGIRRQLSFGNQLEVMIYVRAKNNPLDALRDILNHPSVFWFFACEGTQGSNYHAASQVFFFD
jgi:hypothetical protein